MTQAKSGDKVRIHYTGKLENGEVFDSSRDREPLEFTLGQGGIIPGFEAAVLGMHLSENKTISIPPEQGYGPRMDQLIFDVERNQMPEGLEPETGQQLAVSGQDGNSAPVWVAGVTPEKITLDGNHPLAGKTLVFDLELVEILGAAQE